MKMMTNALLAGTLLLTGAAATAPHADAATTLSPQKADAMRTMEAASKEIAQIDRAIADYKAKLATKKTEIGLDYDRRLQSKLRDVDQRISDENKRYMAMRSEINAKYNADVARLNASKATAAQKKLDLAKLNERKALAMNEIEYRLKKETSALYLQRDRISAEVKAEKARVLKDYSADYTARYITPLEKKRAELQSRYNAAKKVFDAAR